jgi:hypothetical protein
MNDSTWRDSVPDGRISVADYLEKRLRNQYRWYQAKAARYQGRRILLGVLVTAINSVAAILGGVQQGDLMQGGPANFAADPWIAAFTSISLALTGYATLTSSEYLASSYRSTSRQLRKLEIGWEEGAYAGAEGFRRFVTEVEQVLAREHAGWAKRALEPQQQQVAVAPVASTSPAPSPAAPPPLPDDMDPSEQRGPFRDAGAAGGPLGDDERNP